MLKLSRIRVLTDIDLMINSPGPHSASANGQRRARSVQSTVTATPAGTTGSAQTS